eukprot:11191680-Lingulodinium_polyedra.AAC.1
MGEVPKGDLCKSRSKYRNLPGPSWQDKVEAVITPERFDSMARVARKPGESQFAKLRAICP